MARSQPSSPSGSKRPRAVPRLAAVRHVERSTVPLRGDSRGASGAVRLDGPSAAHRGAGLLDVPDPRPFRAGLLRDQPAPLVALANAAALTTRLRLGTMVLAVDYRH